MNLRKIKFFNLLMMTKKKITNKKNQLTLESLLLKLNRKSNNKIKSFNNWKLNNKKLEKHNL